MNRFASPLLRVIFDGADPHEESLYHTLRVFSPYFFTSIRPSFPSLAVWSHHRYFTPCCCYWHLLPQLDCYLLRPALVYYRSQCCTRPQHRSNTHSHFLCSSSTSSRHSRLVLQAPSYRHPSSCLFLGHFDVHRTWRPFLQ